MQTIGMRFKQHLPQPLYKSVLMGIVPKDFQELDSTLNDVLESTHCINSVFCGMAIQVTA
jgi:hypothetical protein